MAPRSGSLQGVDLAPLAMRREVAREHFAVVDEGLVGGEQEHIRGATDLVLRILQAQARLERDETGHGVASRRNEGARRHQDPVALVARQLRAVAPRNPQRASDILRGGLRHGADERAAIGMADLDDPLARDFLAGDAQRLANKLARRGRNEACRHAATARRAVWPGSVRGRTHRNCASGGSRAEGPRCD